MIAYHGQTRPENLFMKIYVLGLNAFSIFLEVQQYERKLSFIW